MAEKTFSLLQKLSSRPLLSPSATPLLFALYAKTDFLKSPAASHGAFLVAAALLKSGADQELISKGLSKKDPLGLFRLWGRACARSKVDAGSDIFWSFLTADDFTKTASAPSGLSFVMEHMGRFFALPSLAVFLWQDPKTLKISSRVLTKNKKVPQSLESGREYESFVSAEEGLGQLLRSVV